MAPVPAVLLWADSATPSPHTCTVPAEERHGEGQGHPPVPLGLHVRVFPAVFRTGPIAVVS